MVVVGWVAAGQGRDSVSWPGAFFALPTIRLAADLALTATLDESRFRMLVAISDSRSTILRGKQEISIKKPERRDDEGV